MSKTSLVPCCYYPTTVILIDDNKQFLSNLSTALEVDFNCKSFDIASKALGELKEQSNKIGSLLTQHFNVPTEYYEPEKSLISVDIYEIHKEIYKKDDIRFSRPVIAVVDFSMPEMNGLELCDSLENTFYKKILLTGEADKNLAVDAFNQRKIDRFVLKNDPNYIALLKQYILELNQEYFVNISREVITAIGESLKATLCSQEFSQLFKKIISENQIIEYYLVNDSGSFLLLDRDAKPTWLVVQTDESMKMYYEIADSNDAPVIILEMLDTKERIPFFFKPGSENRDPKTWRIYPASTLESEHKIHYALVEDTDHLINRNEITSYKEYLNMS